MKPIKIGDRLVGEGHPVFIIAEAGINHNKDKELAKEMIKVAADCGVDAIKFQTFNTDEFMANKKVLHRYEEAGQAKEESMYEMFKRLELPWEWHRELFEHALSQGVLPLSSPADKQAVDLLEKLGVPIFKLASEDLINLPLVKHVSKKEAPVILSSGMATEEEVGQALECFENPQESVILLHCVSLYPTPAEEANLKRMAALRDKFDVSMGYSDHTDGITAAIGAVAMGAVLIEKHYTLDKSLPGPDHSFSADPGELKELVRKVREMEKLLGDGAVDPGEKEWAMRLNCRRSIVADAEIKKGMVLEREMVHFRRPGTGLKPIEVDKVLGKKANRDIPYNEQLKLDYFD